MQSTVSMINSYLQDFEPAFLVFYFSVRAKRNESQVIRVPRVTWIHRSITASSQIIVIPLSIA